MCLRIDINCDMGEWSGEGISASNATGQVAMAGDAAIMPYISSVNIACGGHAGDLVSMEKTIELASRHGVSPGAHPGFPDRAGFGRVALAIESEALRNSLVEQIETLRCIASSLGTQIHHVKLHGALYNLAAEDPALARLIAGIVAVIDPNMVIYGLPGSAMETAAIDHGLTFFREAFADRAYRDDGSLLPRDMTGAVIEDAEEMIRRVISMVTSGRVTTVSGRSIAVNPHTVCVHGDNPVAPAFVKYLSKALKEAGIAIGVKNEME